MKVVPVDIYVEYVILIISVDPAGKDISTTKLSFKIKAKNFIVK